MSRYGVYVSFIVPCLLATTLSVGCHEAEPSADTTPDNRSLEGPRNMAITLRSSAFDQMSPVPQRFTCEGDDISPPLAWSGIPPETKSLVLIVDDPDAPDPKAPKRTWVHWVLFDIPEDVRELPENAARSGLPEGTQIGKNDWGRRDYGGPCPPTGKHRYVHKIYALDTTLGLKSPTKAELEEAMEGHILARGELIGTYEKKRG